MATMDPGISFPGESEDYRRARNRLLEAEAELRRAVERVAAQRRALPLGGVVPDDYRFEEACDRAIVRFSKLFEAGKVREAEKALAAWLRDNPADKAKRTFLFELLCFSGQYDRAEKQLGVLAKDGGTAEIGAVLYYSALHAEKTRHDLFRKQEFPQAEAAPSPPGVWNGKPFQSIRDADDSIGPRLEVFAAGAYLWIPFEHVASVEMEAPKKLRDTFWMPAFVMTGPTFQGTDIGEVLLPVEFPFSC